jgi:hypothetical protein
MESDMLGGRQALLKLDMEVLVAGYCVRDLHGPA